MNIRLVYEPMNGGYGLYIIDRSGERIASAQPIVMMMHEHKHQASYPALKVDDKQDFQALFDDLWCMGMRPSARSDEYKAQLASLNNHLNDMRALVFSKTPREDLKING